MSTKISNNTSHTQSKKNLFIVAITSAIIGIIAFSPIWLRNNGQYMDYGDYYLQYVPFIKELKRMIISGNISWSWNSFLGDSFISAYSYYTVFNPFAWIAAVFPDKYLLYGTLLSTILKLSISSVSSMLFMRQFCKKDTFAIIGALLYTFSGFTVVNTSFYFFLDVIAIFPFLWYSLEKLINENKHFPYVCSLFFNAIINYYFFISTVLLTIIYVFFRLKLYRLTYLKQNIKNILHILGYSLIGVGCAGIALFPSFFSILGSGKAMESIGKNIVSFFWPQKYLDLIKALVAPIESGRFFAFYEGSIWSSNAVYLPIFGCICVIHWLITKKDWLKKLCIAFLLCYFVPILNSTFSLFSNANYTRWLYGMALIFALVTAITLEETENSHLFINKKLINMYAFFTAGLLLAPTTIYILHYYGYSFINIFASLCTADSFMGYPAVISMLILTFMNYIALWLLSKKKHFNTKLVVSLVIIFSSLNFGVFNELNYDKSYNDYDNQYLYKKTMTEGITNTENSYQYRIDHSGKINNYGLFKNFPSVYYYNSILNSNSLRFACAVGMAQNSATAYFNSPAISRECTNALLSVKYYYDYDSDYSVPSGFSYLKTENNTDIYINNNYLPMGFTYKTYCTESQLSNLSPEKRAEIMLDSIVVSDSDKNIADKILKHQSTIKSDFDFDAAIQSHRLETCSYFEGTTKGFNATISLKNNNIVFFSIPNDDGWKITVNGKPAQIIDVNYGLLGIYCNAGENNISATYQTKGLLLGSICTTCSLAAYILISVIVYKKRYLSA